MYRNGLLTTSKFLHPEPMTEIERILLRLLNITKQKHPNVDRLSTVKAA